MLPKYLFSPSPDYYDPGFTYRTPIQSAHPWRATIRTLFQAIIGFAAMWGLIVEAFGIDTQLPWVAASLAVTAGITRVMSLPAVDDWLSRFIPWLATGVHTEPDLDLD